MMEITPLEEIAAELPLLKSIEERGKLLSVVGALVLRRISLDKASEIMDMQKESFLGLLDALGLEYSYMDKEDVEAEKTW